MNVLPIRAVDLDLVAGVMRTGRPWLPEHTDFWLWHECFGDTSFVALDGGRAARGVLACLNQSKPADLYIDQVAVDPAWRGGLHRDFKRPGKDRAVFEKRLT